MTDDQALGNLKRIKHIVVLMMENRSFDQMLGFLTKNGRLDDVNGLTGGEVNYDPEGEPHQVFEWDADQTSFHPPQDHSGKVLDPCHGPACVAEQLGEYHAQAPGGFVKNFVATRKDKHGHPVPIPQEYWGLPMGYYSETHLPVYDLLARQYCVCDAWHASIPGDTWPNRLYAMAGRDGPSVVHKPGLLHDLVKWLHIVPGVAKLANAPVFEVEAFTRQLALNQWRWYSHDPATLRGADKAYRDFRHLNRDNFAYFDRKRVSLKTEVAEAAFLELHSGFLDDAANGDLPEVSWIDPNFIDTRILDPNSNDDHPPSDVHAGQALVLELYEALVNSDAWQDTLLIIVYDEHGGFHDHVSPPPVSVGDPCGYATLGVRVPALIIGPRVKKHVHHETLEHTSLIATILRCVVGDSDEAIRSMPWRVQAASHLGGLLEAEPRADMLDRNRLREQITQAREKLDEWRTKAREGRRARDGQRSPDTDGGAGQAQELLDWQEQFLGFALTMRNAGLPPGQP
jgi:phospholipase C